MIGTRSRKDKTAPPRFPRLFFAFLKTEYDGMKEKEYNRLPDHKKKEYVESYQNTIFRSGNKLRVCVTKDHLRAIVLEHTLIKYFKSKVNVDITSRYRLRGRLSVMRAVRKCHANHGQGIV